MTPQDFGKDFDLGIPGIGGPDRARRVFRTSPGLQRLRFARMDAAGTRGRKLHDQPQLTWIKGAHEFVSALTAFCLKLSHWQPELGGGPRGVIDFDGDITSLNGGAAPTQYNTLRRVPAGAIQPHGQVLQYVLATGREWQFAGYVTDRYQVSPN